MVLPQFTVDGCPHLLLTKALVPALKPTTIGEVKFTPKVFQSNALQYFYQQLMAEAPEKCKASAPGFRACRTIRHFGADWYFRKPNGSSSGGNTKIATDNGRK